MSKIKDVIHWLYETVEDQCEKGNYTRAAVIAFTSVTIPLALGVIAMWYILTMFGVIAYLALAFGMAIAITRFTLMSQFPQDEDQDDEDPPIGV